MARQPITDRQMDVLRLVAEGNSNAEIGQKLFLTEDTVKQHMRRVFKALGARDRAHAVAIGYQRGLLGGER